jgi:hypothetical protein
MKTACDLEPAPDPGWALASRHDLIRWLLSFDPALRQW